MPTELKDIFDNDPKLFIMGHSQGGFYGQSNHHDNKTLAGSEVISGKQYDYIIDDFKSTLADKHGEVYITSEGCNADNRGQAKDDGGQ